MQNWAAGRVADTLEFSTETYGVGFRRAAAMEGGGNPHGLSDSEWKYYQYAKSQPNVRTNVRDARGNIHSFYFSSGPQIQRGSSRHGEGRSHGNNELVVEKGEYYGNENTGKNYGFSKAVSRARMPLSWYRLTERIWCASLISRKQKGE